MVQKTNPSLGLTPNHAINHTTCLAQPLGCIIAVEAGISEHTLWNILSYGVLLSFYAETIQHYTLSRSSLLSFTFDFEILLAISCIEVHEVL